jgi:hypothetical protein
VLCLVTLCVACVKGFIDKICVLTGCVLIVLSMWNVIIVGEGALGCWRASSYVECCGGCGWWPMSEYQVAVVVCFMNN